MRADAREILRFSLDAVEPGQLVERTVEEGLEVGSSPTVLVAVGKAAVGMARGALTAPDLRRISRGLVLVPEDSGGARDGLPFPVLEGGHPLPTAGGLRASRRILELVRGLEPEDHLLLLLSGGGSALLTFPAEGVSLDDLRRTTELLLGAGASIGQLNAVRKHLERLKGGRLALEAAAGAITSLVISDVVGDPPAVIASGPVSPDPSTYDDALAVLARLEVRDQVPRAVLDHLSRGARGEVPETPGEGDPRLARVEYRIVGSVETAMEAALQRARRSGYRTHRLTSALEGEARVAGRRLGALAGSVRAGLGEGSPPVCLVTGGETTVTVRGSGRGGRNQEVALGAALELAGERGLLVASMGTDGVDGPTDAAGALATGSTLSRAGAGGLDPHRALEENDAYPFFRELGDLITTGPTGTNVMDLQLVLASGAGDA